MLQRRLLLPLLLLLLWVCLLQMLLSACPTSPLPSCVLVWVHTLTS
jgi:hypothetical protein